MISSSFTPFTLSIHTLHGASLYPAWRYWEFAIFEEAEDEHWYVCHLPTASALPVRFLRPVDAAQFVLDLIPLRNNWIDVGHGDWLRILPEILKRSERNNGARYRTQYIYQPTHFPTANGYGARPAA